jgi:hypothetical protein
MGEEKKAETEPKPELSAKKKEQLEIEVAQAHPTEVLWMSDILDHPWRIFYLNMIAGIGRGLGFALGFTILAGATLAVAYRVAKSAVNLPVVGKTIGSFIAEVQEHASEVRKGQP